MKKIFINVRGCERRSLDAERLQRYFFYNNNKIVNQSKKADVIIYISCGAVNESIAIALKEIKKKLKYNAELIVAGCLPVVAKKRLDKIFQGKTFCTLDLDKNPDKVDKLFPENKIKFRDIEDANIPVKDIDKIRPLSKIKSTFTKVPYMGNIYRRLERFFLKIIYGEKSLVYRYLSDEEIYVVRIAWGCNNNCSYCNIRRSTGFLHSKSIKQCIDEFKKGLKEGYKNIVLTAENVGSYGLDTNNSLPELLGEITKLSGEYKIILKNINPRWFIRYNKDFEEILKRQKISHIYIPIQSGSSRVLDIMNRYSDVKEIGKNLIKIKKKFPNLAIYTACIVGFPTETMDEFKQTLKLIIDGVFTSGRLFPFSPNKGTLADKIKPEITGDEILSRMKYAKKFLRKAGYKIIYLPKSNFFLFEKKN